VSDRITHDPNPRDQIFPEVWSDDRHHIGDETCWCNPIVTDTTITHRVEGAR